jgi:hypothetical protein
VRSAAAHKINFFILAELKVLPGTYVKVKFLKSSNSISAEENTELPKVVVGGKTKLSNLHPEKALPPIVLKLGFKNTIVPLSA